MSRCSRECWSCGSPAILCLALSHGSFPHCKMPFVNSHRETILSCLECYRGIMRLAHPTFCMNVAPPLTCTLIAQLLVWLQLFLLMSNTHRMLTICCVTPLATPSRRENISCLIHSFVGLLRASYRTCHGALGFHSFHNDDDGTEFHQRVETPPLTDENSMSCCTKTRQLLVMERKRHE